MFLKEVFYAHQGCIYLIKKCSKNSNNVKYCLLLLKKIKYKTRFSASLL